MFASLRYIQTRHEYSHIEGQPDMNPHSANSANPAPATNGAGPNGTAQALQNGDASTVTDETKPDTPEVFHAALRELARDLVIKEQQIEYIISVLPGIGNSEADQNARIHALETELREADAHRKTAMQERDQMLNLLGDLAAQCKRVY